MKSRHLIIGLSLTTATALLPLNALAATEQITNLTVQANLTKSDILNITEQIDYDFAGNAPHAITHLIPLSYQDDQGRTYLATFHLLSTNLASSTNGTEAQLTLPPGTGSGVHHFQLHYTLSPMTLKGPTDDVLRFNSSGLGWPVPILHVALTLTTPAPAGSLTCYTGSYGTSSANCQSTQSGNTAAIVTDATLPAGQNLSIYCDFPPNTFSTYLQPSGQRLTPLLIIAIASVLASLGLVTAGAVWLALRHSSKRAGQDI